MTVLSAPLAATRLGDPDFRIEILTPLGQPQFPRRIFGFRDLNMTGLDRVIDATVTPGGIAKSLKFSGLKDYVAAHRGEVVTFEVNDGDGVWHAAGCGILTVGHSPDDLLLGGNHGPLVRAYDASTSEMLERSVIWDNRYYPPQDVGAIVRQLVETFRHPSILFDPSLIPNVGVRLDEGFRLPAADFNLAIKQLADKVLAANGLEIAWGVRADRKFYFNFPEGVEKIAFDAEAQNYRELPVDLKGLCTAVVWEVGNKPNVTNYTGVYKPTDLVYVSVIDPAAHAELRAFKGLQAMGDPFTRKWAFRISSANFNNPDNGWNSDPSGNRLLGATSDMPTTGVTSGTYQIDPGTTKVGEQHARQGLPIHGFSLRYAMDPGAAGVLQTAYAWIIMVGIYEDGSGTTAAYTNFPLPYTIDPTGATVYQDFDVKLPPADRWYNEQSGKWARFVTFSFAGVQVSRATTGAAIFSISDFRFMCLNTPLLDATAQAEKKLPAQNPAQLRKVTYQDGQVRERFIQPTPIVDHSGRPDGTKRLPATEVRYEFTRERRFRCVMDVGNPAREGDTDRLIERISRGVDKRNERLEIIRPSALL